MYRTWLHIYFSYWQYWPTPPILWTGPRGECVGSLSSSCPLWIQSLSPRGGYVSAHVKSHCTRGAALLQAKLCLSSDKGSDDCPFNAALIVFEHHATLIQKRQKHKFVSLSQSVEPVVSRRFWLHIILSFIHIYIPLQSHVFNTGLVTTATELWPASTSCLSFLISITSHNPNHLIFSPSCSILQYWYRGVLWSSKCVLSTR